MREMARDELEALKLQLPEADRALALKLLPLLTLPLHLVY